MRPSDDLPYIVELWNLTRTTPERILGRAFSIGVARAIFTAARTEHLNRRILLRHGLQVLEQTDQDADSPDRGASVSLPERGDQR